MSNDTKDPKLEIALDARKFELELFWRRALFFWGFIASAFIGFANTSAKHPIFAIVICCFGFICSLSWTLVNRGSKYWYENWENKVKKLGGDEIKKLFEEKEPNTKVGLWTAQRFSVSRISIALSE